MKNLLLKKGLPLTIMLISFNSFACDCECEGDCSFSGVASGMEFVALVKVIEYSDFLDEEIMGYDRKMPFSMTVEIIKKYKGAESRKRIKIWGDDGAQCRPYIAEFEIEKCYLIAPTRIEKDSELGKQCDYDFSSCWTDYLTVDIDKGIALGEYSKMRNNITLKEFENELEK
ncbi:hypothetical protein I5168_09575 [Nonlabens sp. SCSIO 43208]|uniref:hypothetical protein n=1 Tax=Nonlabens sp. SCSIO 43208 TaxID=2793009 RepID=UPI003D6A249C